MRGVTARVKPNRHESAIVWLAPRDLNACLPIHGHLEKREKRNAWIKTSKNFVPVIISWKQ
jgi:hypothetical protein